MVKYRSDLFLVLLSVPWFPYRNLEFCVFYLQKSRWRFFWNKVHFTRGNLGVNISTWKCVHLHRSIWISRFWSSPMTYRNLYISHMKMSMSLSLHDIWNYSYFSFWKSGWKFYHMKYGISVINSRKRGCRYSHVQFEIF